MRALVALSMSCAIDLLDYVIVRNSQVGEVRITRAMRGAECWTDHRLIISKMAVTIRPQNGRNRTRKRRINCDILKDETKRQDFAARASSALLDISSEQITVAAQWPTVASRLHEVAEETLGTERPRDRDWFRENIDEIRALLIRKKRRTYCYSS